MLIRVMTKAALIAFAVSASLAAHAVADTQRQIEVPAGELIAALESLARQSDVELVYRPEQLKSITTRGVSGLFSTEEAIRKLLEGTRLRLRTDEATGAMLIVPVDSRSTRATAAGEGIQGRLPTASLFASSETPASSGGGSTTTSIEEVVVTAQKRIERLIDVPQSVSVLSTDELTKQGATQFRDFAVSVPGLSYQTAGAGLTQLTMRGVTTGYDIGPTVAVYVDEVPYGSSSAFSLAAQHALDVALFDVDRIEVLRGPQGTLYGASTMGGLLKYVSKKPDTTRFGGNAQTGFSTTHSGGVSYNAAAAVNMPLSEDTAALRASGFFSRDGGFVDNVANDVSNVDRSNIYGGRLDLLMTPSESFSIRLGAFLQNIERDGQPTVEYLLSGAPEFGSLEQRRPFDEPSDQRFRLLSATLTYGMELAELTSISSYQTVRSESGWDISGVYVPLLRNVLQREYSGVSDPNHVEVDKFTQEVRLTSRTGSSLDWVVGAFYTDESSVAGEEFFLLDPGGAPALNDLYVYLGDASYTEYAGFGDLTWHITDTLDVTGGLRYARNKQEYTQTGSGLFIGSRPLSKADEDVTTYLLNARQKISDHATLYARYATGYRPGGPNISANDPATGAPLGLPTFDADTLKSYEIGFKGESADRRHSIDVSAYSIDWSNIQVLAIRGGFALRANAPGGAEVRGGELALTTRPTDDLTVSAAFAYQDATLSNADDDLKAARGERLPNVPKVTGALSTTYALPLGSLKPSIGASVQYVSDRKATFGSTGYRMPSYTSVDLRAGVELSQFNLQLYVRNLTDERGQISSMLPQFGTRIAILQPRTVGFVLTTRF